MKPFGMLVHERSQDLERAAREATALIQKYSDVSAGKLITLEQASWLGAIVYLGMEEAKRQMGNKVHTVVATDTVEARDSAS